MEKSALRDIVPTFISDDLKIQNIFHLRWWTVDEGLDYIQGVFGEFTLEDGSVELQMLDGNRYSATEYPEEIHQLQEAYGLLKQIWDRSGRKKQCYSPLVFIKFGLTHQHLSKMLWDKDAAKKGLINDLADPPTEKDASDEKPLHPKSKNSLLRIIAGLTHLYLGGKYRGQHTEIHNDFVTLAEKYPELKIDKDVLRNNINEALAKYAPGVTSTDFES